MLDDPAALDTYGTCSTTDPGDETKKFEAVACAEPHSWQAVSVIDIDKDASYLGPPAQKRGATRRARPRPSSGRRDPLELKWSFQWPSKEAFDAGQRYGLCWVPDKA